MRVGSDGSLHLTYCTNIHPAERWGNVADTLKTYLPPLKSELSPKAPFGVGLRLSNDAAETLLEGDRLSRFREWLEQEGLYVFTLNGFPYGRFHGDRVKDRVYQPDWRSPERVAYTRRLARILAALLPDPLDGSISTSPLSYKPWLETEEREEAFRVGSRHLAEVTATLTRLESETGSTLHVDLEPEPDCLIENTEESIAFFEDWLWPVGGEHLADLLGLSQTEAEEALRRHVKLCYDTCHFAVEYESPEEAFEHLEGSRVPIGKIQLSSALRIPLPDDRSAVADSLRPFAEDTYLHQVIERRQDGTLHRYRDLPQALPHVHNEDAEEWRIHFHVPLYTETYDGLQSTRPHISRTLEAVQEDPFCSHLEIETYTWDVLPSRLKEDLPTSLRREYEWILSNFA